jgi:hypothetical protein
MSEKEQAKIIRVEDLNPEISEEACGTIPDVGRPTSPLVNEIS